MIILDSATKIQLVLDGGVSANNVEVYAAWKDHTTTGFSPGYTRVSTDGSAAADIVAAPAATTYRFISELVVTNTDTFGNGFTFQLLNGATVTRLFYHPSLGVGYSIRYDETSGWSVTDTSGAALMTSAGVSGKLLRETYLTAGTSVNLTVLTNAVEFEMFGGGGGGGGVKTANTSQGAASGGGGGGGYLRGYRSVNSGSTLSYTIGAAGTAGTGTTPSAGGDGGDTTLTIGATTFTAKGGKGAAANSSSTAVHFTLGGAGQLPTNGDLNVAGAPGSPGAIYSIATTGGRGGNGGGAAGQYNGAQGSATNGTSSTASFAAYGPGGGGSGALADASATSPSGGAGGQGMIIIREYS